MRDALDGAPRRSKRMGAPYGSRARPYYGLFCALESDSVKNPVPSDGDESVSFAELCANVGIRANPGGGGVWNASYARRVTKVRTTTARRM